MFMLPRPLHNALGWFSGFSSVVCWRSSNVSAQNAVVIFGVNALMQSGPYPRDLLQILSPTNVYRW